MSDPTQNNKAGTEHLTAADTGNASNPSPHNADMEPAAPEQLLDEKAEKYVRESANIEDLPDPQEEQEADETLKEEK